MKNTGRQKNARKIRKNQAGGFGGFDCAQPPERFILDQSLSQELRLCEVLRESASRILVVALYQTNP